MKKIILIFLLFIGCKDYLVDNVDEFYNIDIETTSYCKHISDNWYSIELDSNYIQTFIKANVETDDVRVRYVDWEWVSTDTVNYYFNGINYGIIPPTNQSSVILDNKGSSIFGFHQLMRGDTISVLGIFIDSKILLNGYGIVIVNFIVEN